MKKSMSLRSRQFNVRLSEWEMDQLRVAAKHEKISRSAFARQCILDRIYGRCVSVGVNTVAEPVVDFDRVRSEILGLGSRKS